MKAILFRFITAVVVVFSTTNCSTVYDPYGYPHEVVDPAAAVVGAAAVGLLAYGLANSNSGDCRHYNHNNHYYEPRSYNYRPYHGHSHYYRPNCDY